MKISGERNQPRRNCAPVPRYRKGSGGTPRPKAVEIQPFLTAESWERSTWAKGNLDQTPDARTQRRGFRQDGLIRIREAAKRDRKARFSNLMHHITVELLHHIFCELKRRATPGIDGETWYDYKEMLTERLPELHAEIQSERYRAKPSRQAWITKDNGEMRALGIAALEDKSSNTRFMLSDRCTRLPRLEINLISTYSAINRPMLSLPLFPVRRGFGRL